jgi:uncharacterized protein YeeX (DUF496 family)
MRADQLLKEDTVLARTTAGQREVLDEARQLDDTQRRMLLLVNGFTPLSSLIQRLPSTDDPHGRVRMLLDRGLVSRVEE